MVARARLLQARLLPGGWLDVLRQVSLFALAYFAYRLARGLVEGRANAAFQHARDLISVERTLHVFVEPSVQAWASGSHLLIGMSSWLYVNAQTTVTLGALVYLYLCHNRSFYFVRNMFMIAMAIALVGYVVFPTAPPRFMPEWGFIDSVSDVTGVHVSHASATASALLLDAAVPDGLGSCIRWNRSGGSGRSVCAIALWELRGTGHSFLFTRGGGMGIFSIRELAGRRREHCR